MKDWAVIERELRKILITTAHIESTTYYYKIAVSFKVNLKNDSQREKLFDALIAIGEMENKAGRPLINSLALNSKTDKPGNRFYEWWSGITGITRIDLEKRPEYLIAEHQRCFEFWGDITNYEFYK